MHKRLQLDLLGLVIGALEDHEQAEFAEKCRRDPRLRKKYSCWRQRLSFLASLEEDCDPPAGLAERTSAFVFSQVIGSTVVPAVAPTNYSEDNVDISGPCEHFAETSTSLHQQALGGPVVAAKCTTRGASTLDLPTKTRSAREGRQGRGWSSHKKGKYWVHLPSQESSFREGPPLAGAFIQAAWWRILFVTVAVVVVLAVVPPAIYESRVQSATLKCQHFWCWLRGIGDHLAMLHVGRQNTPAHDHRRPLFIAAHQIPAFSDPMLGQVSHPQLSAFPYSESKIDRTQPAFYVAIEPSHQGECKVWIIGCQAPPAICQRITSVIGPISPENLANWPAHEGPGSWPKSVYECRFRTEKSVNVFWHPPLSGGGQSDHWLGEVSASPVFRPFPDVPWGDELVLVSGEAPPTPSDRAGFATQQVARHSEWLGDWR
ncbi:MAG: hypothetical protein NZ899_09045 [Thermoguttaceae bacterium]|nr:hypothetical protein [Thermoguttaceae bacterium]MDW8079890.1 hypothetical protein [Thermoguttaceae bacterium]